MPGFGAGSPFFVGGQNLFTAVQSIYSDGWLWTMDRYTVDGVTGKAGSFASWINPAHLLSQTVSANQVAVPAARAAMNNSICANFAGGQFYDSNQSAATWAFLTGGSGVSVIQVFEPTTVAAAFTIANTYLNNANPGYRPNFIAASGSVIMRKAGAVLISSLSAGAMTAAPTVFRHAHATAQNPDVLIKRSGLSTVTADYAAAAAADAPPGTLRVGANRAGAEFFTGYLRALLIKPSLLTADQLAIVNAWILSDCGVAA